MHRIASNARKKIKKLFCGYAPHVAWNDEKRTIRNYVRPFCAMDKLIRGTNGPKWKIVVKIDYYFINQRNAIICFSFSVLLCWNGVHSDFVVFSVDRTQFVASNLYFY